MRTTAISLQIREASVLYGANRVLDRVWLSAAGGEFIALLRASGCGKTTLSRAICGFVGLASGSILVSRQDVTRLSPERRSIAMVFQSYALWPHMTVVQNIGYNLKLRHVGRTEIGARIDELLAMLRLYGLGERKTVGDWQTDKAGNRTSPSQSSGCAECEHQPDRCRPVADHP